MSNSKSGIRRRSVFGMAGTFALASMRADRSAEAQTTQPGGVNRNSAPSQLQITDMRAIRIASNYDYPIIRIDTNQGVYGLGEVRDAGNEGMALVLKPHIVGKNPLNIEPLLDSVRNFTNQRRFGGGYSALDIALYDIAGKVYGVPDVRIDNRVSYPTRFPRARYGSKRFLSLWWVDHYLRECPARHFAHSTRPTSDTPQSKGSKKRMPHSPWLSA